MRDHAPGVTLVHSFTPVPGRPRSGAPPRQTANALLDLLWASPVALAVLDRSLRLLDVNVAMSKTLDVRNGGAEGRTLAEVAAGWSEPLRPEMDRVAGACRFVLETERPFLNLVARGPRPRGGSREWLCSFFPIPARGGPVGGVLAMISDVTKDEGTAEREADEFRRRILGVVGHDLRTPLAALSGSAHLLARSPLLPPELSRAVVRILANAARMDRMISVLLDYARLQAGRAMPLRCRECDVSAIAEVVADELRETHPGCEIRIAGTGDPAGEWDPDRVAQALSNLISNALSHGSPGSPVEVRWREEGDTLCVEVLNEGAPIPAEHLARIFEPFQRAAGLPDDGKDGLGLGLFIVRAIAGAHGGEALVRSGEGERTTFTVRLPRRPGRAG